MMYQSLEKLFQEFAFDICHSFFLYPMGYVTGLMAGRFKVPHILTVVGNDIKKYIFSPEKVALCRSGLENADRVVALSRDLVEMADSLTPVEDKTRLIYNSVEIPHEFWQPDGGQTRGDKPFKIGTAGIFKFAKGLPYLFKALARLKRSEKISLELLGEIRNSEAAFFDQLQRDLDIQDILNFQKTIPHDQVGSWLRELDLFVLPSISEGCPNIVMEAMANGLPVIATRTGAVDVLIEDGVSGIIVPWGDSDSIEKAVREIIKKPDRAVSLGQNGRERMREFSPQKEFQDWQTLYKELI